MGRQYRLTSTQPVAELFEGIVSALSASDAYRCVACEARYTGFEHAGAGSVWGVDIEVSVEREGVLLRMHAGNAKQVLGLIKTAVGRVGSPLAVEEI
ncbi:hypothetical protein [Pseudomonas sp.]|uniref:hypothetical protein n=1 Tax=Pseudomonas sp. TaxID=306 RepID=UPI0028ABED72|nr:hypothetical protein [Pseudomonas sp.]